MTLPEKRVEIEGGALDYFLGLGWTPSRRITLDGVNSCPFCSPSRKKKRAICAHLHWGDYFVRVNCNHCETSWLVIEKDKRTYEAARPTGLPEQRG